LEFLEYLYPFLRNPCFSSWNSGFLGTWRKNYFAFGSEVVKANATKLQSQLDQVNARITALDSYSRSDNLIITCLPFSTSAEVASVPHDN